MRIASFKLGLTILGSAAVLGAGATAGVALGSPSHAADNSSIVQHAIQKTSKVASGHFSFTAGITGEGTSTTGFSVGGAGGFDTKHQASTFTLNLGALASLLGGASGGASVPKSIDIVTLKSVVYVHIPSVASQLAKGKEWLKFDSTSLPKSVTKTVNPSQLSKINPQQALAKLTASLAVHKVGSATVHGSSTTQYRVLVDIAKVIGILPKADQAAELKALKGANLKTLPIDVYIDGSGYVRRVVIALANLKVQAGTAPASIKVSIDLYDFGHSVNVTAPPASKTVDGAKLLAQLTAGLGGGTGG
jgi:hypothetical protein